MHISRRIKSLIKPVYHYLRKGKALGYIFMLHRIDDIDPNRLIGNENMKVSPLFLDMFLDRYRNEYDYISLCDVPERLRSNTSKRFMAFTSDDGYKDNYTKALPIFRKYNVPFTIFVSTDLPDHKAILWWYALEDYILANNIIKLRNGMCLSTETKEEKEMAFMYIRSKILDLDQCHLLDGLQGMFAEELQWLGKCETFAMSWDDIRACASDPLVTIGGHTRHHYNLKKLMTEDDVRNEILDGCMQLREKAGIDPVVFAYPFGSPNEVGGREIKIASTLGFDLACIATGGYCGSRNKNVYALPRIMFTEQIWEEGFI